MNNKFLLISHSVANSTITCKYYSDFSLLGYDAIFIDVKSVVKDYIIAYQAGKLNDIISKRIEEIQILVNNGVPFFFYNIDYTEYKKNFTFEQYNNLFKILFNFENIEFIIAKGANISFASEEINSYLNSIINRDYEVYFNNLNNNKIIKLASIINTEKIVSYMYEFNSSLIVFLPSLKISNVFQGSGAINNVIEYIKSFSIIVDTVPDWVKNFKLPNEVDIETKILNTNNEITRLNNEIILENNNLTDIQKYKQLIYSQGDMLHLIVNEVLVELGFNIIEQSVKNRTDTIMEYNEQPFVVEVKGLAKSAGERNGAQLEKWASQYLDDHNKQPKSVLIINHFINTSLNERKEEAFPKQMHKYCEARNHCLITTTQLLCILIDARKNPAKKEDIVNKLINTIGVYKEYSNWSDYLDIII